jgi:hypothetical protein
LTPNPWTREGAQLWVVKWFDRMSDAADKLQQQSVEQRAGDRPFGLGPPPDLDEGQKGGDKPKPGSRRRAPMGEPSGAVIAQLS